MCAYTGRSRASLTHMPINLTFVVCVSIWITALWLEICNLNFQWLICEYIGCERQFIFKKRNLWWYHFWSRRPFQHFYCLCGYVSADNWKWMSIIGPWEVKIKPQSYIPGVIGQDWHIAYQEFLMCCRRQLTRQYWFAFIVLNILSSLPSDMAHLSQYNHNAANCFWYGIALKRFNNLVANITSLLYRCQNLKCIKSYS